MGSPGFSRQGHDWPWLRPLALIYVSDGDIRRKRQSDFETATAVRYSNSDGDFCRKLHSEFEGAAMARGHAAEAFDESLKYESQSSHVDGHAIKLVH